MHLFQHVQERLFASGNQRSTRDVICKISQFKMVDVKNLTKVNKRSTDLAHVMYVLSDYDVSKIGIFGFTCPLSSIMLINNDNIETFSSILKAQRFAQ